MAINQDLKTCIDSIKFFRKIAQNDIADAIGVSPNYLSDVINGRAIFSSKLRKKLEDTYPDCMTSLSIRDVHQTGDGNYIMGASADAMRLIEKTIEQNEVLICILREQLAKSQAQSERLLSLMEKMAK